ncbi:MAG TPA: MlaD family protein [Nocardia sp.]|uniref:MlaD family protein n=1 Tax=Nocardia TaxID=1817 RepID=UPI0024552399|nr:MULTISPECIES: MlaD family protein [Nocardia]HLS78391.1 MlaD family protein [Nocardia sp.]
MTRIPPWLSGLALALVMVLGSWYLIVDVLTIDPAQRRNEAVVDLRDAAGLRPGSEVVYRGVDIGRVEEVRSHEGLVRMRFSYDADYRIPVDSSMRVENLSALGEPVFALLPHTTEGPYLPDGAHLVEAVELPTSVPDLLATTSGLLDQIDPESVRKLTDALAASVEGLDTTVPAARRGAELLLTTLSRHEGSLEVILRELVKVMGDVEWARATLTEAPPMLERFGETLGVSYEYLFAGSEVLRGREVLGSWRAQQDELAEFLAKMAPELGAIGVALRPATQATGPLLASMDLGTLLEQAIATLPGESVRFTVAVPR